jgi:glycosyltransferase involved in cell wall biosynthesis
VLGERLGLKVGFVAADAHPPWNHAGSILTRRMIECLSSTVDCTLITTQYQEEADHVKPRWTTLATRPSGVSTLDAIRLGMRASEESYDVIHIVGASVIAFSPVYKLLGATGAIVRQIFSPHDLNDGLVRPIRWLVNNLFVGAYAFTSPWNGPWERDLGYGMRKFLLRPPIDCELYRPINTQSGGGIYARSHDYNILYMGPLWPSRFPAQNVLEALRLLLKKGFDIGLEVLTSTRSSVMLGEEVLALGKRLGVDRNIALERRDLSENERVSAYNSADAVIFPYAPEPEQLADPPFAILEAMGCGRTVISTRVLSVPEIVKDGINGFLIESESSNDICDGIVRALSSPDKDIVGIRARETVLKQFSYPVLRQRLIETYQSLMAR